MKSSRAEYQRRWRRINLVSNKASQRKYYLKNKAKMQAYQRVWIKNNRAKIAAKRKERRIQSAIKNPNLGKENYAKHRESILSRQLERRSKNREKSRSIGRYFYHKHKGNRSAYAKKYRAKNLDKVKANIKSWRARNRVRINNYANKRYATEPMFRLKSKTSAAMNKVVKRFKTRKHNKTLVLLGCGLEQFKAHIESQFLEGMSWGNRSDWHIDHIRPCASFDLTDPEQQKECFHFSNLRPEWPVANIKKSSWWNGKLFRPSKQKVSA